MQKKTNWIALIVAAAAGMGVGYLWYGVLFLKQWMAGNGMTMNGDIMLKNGIEVPKSNLPMVVNVFTLLLYACLIEWLVLKTASFSYRTGATLGAVLGTISFFGIYAGNRFAANPTSLSMVDGSYMLVLFTVMACIIGGWRSR